MSVPCDCMFGGRPPREALLEQYQKKEQLLAAELYVLADSCRAQYYSSQADASVRTDPLGPLLVKTFRQV